MSDRHIAEIYAAKRQGYLIALNLWHEADPDHCGGECFRESDIQLALARVTPPDVTPDPARPPLSPVDPAAYDWPERLRDEEIAERGREWWA
jgi:hypothetical protein